MISPDAYAQLRLSDQWLEDSMQEVEAAWIVEQTADCNTVLDLGWGSGIVARALKDAGRNVMVVEGSSEGCHVAYHHHGIRSLQCMFEDFSPNTRYDCVIASFILEHIRDPVGLLTRARQWSDKLVVVVGNANSYHRQIAVQMGIQTHLASLSARDKTVGHLYIFDLSDTRAMLHSAGWIPTAEKGLMLKTLPNSMLAKLDPAIIKAMCEIEVAPEVAANIGLVARGV